MKTIYLTLFSLLVLLSACGNQDRSKTIATNDKAAKIEVIDFYGTHRCVTCKAIEANTAYTLDTYFDEAVKAGKIEFKKINVDKEENYDMAEKFEATGTALFINVINDGKENHIDLTNFAFKKGRDQAAFSAELKDKINEQLKTL